MNPIRRLHLTEARLDRMLLADPDRFAKLLAKHPAIGDRFESEPLLRPDTRQLLREAFAPPADLTARLTARLSADLDSPTARSTALDLLGLGLATVRELTRDDPA